MSSTSDATLGKLETADAETYAEICARFAHWEDIDIHYAGRVWTSTVHGFCGFSRQTLLDILQARCRELDVAVHFEHEAESVDDFADSDLIVASDGINSGIREQFKVRFRPDLDHRPNYFIWLGTTKALDAFTFYFGEDDAGLWRVHAYQYEQDHAGEPRQPAPARPAIRRACRPRFRSPGPRCPRTRAPRCASAVSTADVHPLQTA